MFTTEKQIDCCGNPTNKEEEHRNTSYVSVCVPPSVEFVVAIIVQLLERFSSFRYGFLELLTTRDNSSSQQPPSQETVKSYNSLYHQHLKRPKYILLVLNWLNELSVETITYLYIYTFLEIWRLCLASINPIKGVSRFT